MNREFFSGGCFLRFTFFYSSEYTTNLSILRMSLISCYHSCLLCKRIWRLIYNANCQLNCCDQIWDLQTITCRYEENYRYLKLPLRITLHQITNGFPHCGLTTLLVYDYVYNMKSSYERFWKSQLGDPYNPTGKLSLYRKIKPAFRMEKYLDDIPKHIHRRALTALRISAHKLEIEVGRYSRDYTPRQNRFCTLCNNAGSAQTGDEFHAIMHCPSFAAQRENLRDKVAGHAPLFNKLNEYEQFIFL